MESLFSLAGLVFGVSGFLSVTKITDVGLDLVKLTQIHTLPLISMLPVGWAYLALGVACLAIAGAMYKPAGSTYYWWYTWRS